MGTLYVVATPIGNLEDVTLRALRTLREVDVIACEDTRHTRRLLQRHGIATPLISYHEHNERRRSADIVRRLEGGQHVALVTDAGMPGVSDPGYVLIREAVAAGISVVPVPGPSALTAALSVSGLPTDRVLFLGFLPRARAARRLVLREVREVPATIVFFEAPHRVHDTLADVAEILGPRQVAVLREMTKLHEEAVRGRADEVATAARVPARGEITIVIEAGSRESRPVRTEGRGGMGSEARHAEKHGGEEVVGAGPDGQEDPDVHLARLLGLGMSRRDAAKVVADAHGIPRREAYRRAVESRKPPPAESRKK